MIAFLSCYTNGMVDVMRLMDAMIHCMLDQFFSLPVRLPDVMDQRYFHKKKSNST